MDVKESNEEGQAFFELIFFLVPLTLMLFLIVGLGNSINASINQQKVIRGYFFSVIKGNSMMPKRQSGFESFEGANFDEVVTHFFIGWKEKFSDGGRNPVAPCFKLNIPDGLSQDSCEDSYSEPEEARWIRVMSVFGVCGATFLKNGEGPLRGFEHSECINR